MEAAYTFQNKPMTHVIRSCSPSNTCQSVVNANLPGLPAGTNARVICNDCTTDNCNNKRIESSSGNGLKCYSCSGTTDCKTLSNIPSITCESSLVCAVSHH
jgi:hypothetical protein